MLTLRKNNFHDPGRMTARESVRTAGILQAERVMDNRENISKNVNRIHRRTQKRGKGVITKSAKSF